MKSKAKPSGHGTAWTAADNELLGSLAGDLPWPMVLAAFNRQRPHRTRSALNDQARKLKINKQAVGNYFTASLIVELAGVSRQTVDSWITDGVNGVKLPARRFGKGKGYCYFICRRDLQMFAKQNPKSFGGLAEPELMQLLDSERLAAEIAAMELPPPRCPTPVECVETGCRYPSVAAAARAAYVNGQRMAVVITTGQRANGYHWRRVSK